MQKYETFISREAIGLHPSNLSAYIVCPIILKTEKYLLILHEKITYPFKCSEPGFFVLGTDLSRLCEAFKEISFFKFHKTASGSSCSLFSCALITISKTSFSLLTSVSTSSQMSSSEFKLCFSATQNQQSRRHSSFWFDRLNWNYAFITMSLTCSIFSWKNYLYFKTRTLSTILAVVCQFLT